MALPPGANVGSYQILSAIGAGGMGEVYRARDSRLNRNVALKVLPEIFARDPDRLARFEREAKALASLNHPNIAAIYGLEDSNGLQALILELVEGPTLADRLADGPIPPSEAFPIARQIAEALEAAHEQGIIHRDLKPANVKVRTDGTVKVLDFGLAKATDRDRPGSDPAHSPTVTAGGTRDGIILGTAAYMSPEQAKGRLLDKRADVWAFGAVLYEMLTGRRAFGGDSVSDTLAHVLMKEPDWSALPTGTPASIRTLLRRCLEKDQKRRLADVADARLEIDDALTAPSSETAPVASSRMPWRVGWVLSTTLVAASLLASIGTWAVMRPAPPVLAVPSQFVFVPPSEDALGISSNFRDHAISPDGRHLIFRSGPPSGGGRLMLRKLDQLDAEPLSGVNGNSPFFSPDGNWIGFFEGGALKKVAIAGGPVITLSRNLGSPQSGSWGDGDNIVFSAEAPNPGLLTVSANGGEAKLLTTTDAARGEVAHQFPSVLPDNRGVLFTIVKSGLEDRELAVLDLESGERRTLLRGGLGAEYVGTGHLAYQASGTLFAVGFDLERLDLRGESVPLRPTLRVQGAFAPKFAVSRTGSLAFVPARAAARSLVWVDRKGHETPLNAPPRAYGTLRLSPHGKRVALGIDDQENDAWIWDLAGETLTRLTFGSTTEHVPIWTPDGRWIVFRSNRAGRFNLYRQASDGSGAVERLTTSDNVQYPNSVTQDGQSVLGAELLAKTGYDIRRFPASPPARPAADSAGTSDRSVSPSETLLATPYAEYAANISPDGRYLAYQSTESGRFEIYVRPYPELGQGQWQISTEGGVAPVWARNQRELFYLDPSNALMAVPIQMSSTGLSVGRPVKVFDTRYGGDFYSYDVSLDGQRFLMRKDNLGGRDTAGVVVALHWFDEVKSRAPSSKSRN